MANKKIEIPKYEGLNGIRATLNNYGYSDAEIGFNENRGTVTLGGRDLMKPEVYDSDNGITYASENDIRESLKNFSDPVVEVTPYYANYAGNNNLPLNSIGFSGGSVTLGGENVPHAFIDENDKAWAKQSVLDKAFAGYKNSVDVRGNYDILDKYERLYGDKIDKLLDSVTDRDKFEYDVEDDPVYEAYKAMYEREGNRSAEDTMAAYSAQTGGYANSAAVTAAADARQYYSQKLNDVIPKLEEMAYNRYIAEYQSDIDALDALRELYTDMFSIEYGVNRDVADDLHKAYAEDIERDRYQEENSRERRKAELEYLLGIQEYEANNIFNEQNYRLGEQKIKKGDQDYRIGEQKIRKNDQDYRIGEQKIRKNDQDYVIGEQKIKKNEQDYLLGEQELVMEQIRQEILEQEKVLNSQQMQKNAQSLSNNAKSNAQNAILNEQKIRKNEQEIQMNDLEYSIKKYKRDLLIDEYD